MEKGSVLLRFFFHAGRKLCSQSFLGVAMAGLDAYESDRRFQVWRYVVGHSSLLLRSNQSDTESIRVEILFKSVDAMNLPTTIDGIQVRLADENEADRIRSDTGCDNAIHKRARVFILQSQGHSGFVIAGVMWANEDQLGYWEPSPFLQETPAQEVALYREQLAGLDQRHLSAEAKDKARAFYRRLMLDVREKAQADLKQLILDVEAGLQE